MDLMGNPEGHMVLGTATAAHPPESPPAYLPILWSCHVSALWNPSEGQAGSVQSPQALQSLTASFVKLLLLPVFGESQKLRLKAF